MQDLQKKKRIIIEACRTLENRIDETDDIYEIEALGLPVFQLVKDKNLKRKTPVRGYALSYFLFCSCLLVCLLVLYYKQVINVNWDK